jgi:serine/threonine protein kinase
VSNVRQKDIDNENRAVSKLCKGGHRNIVQILALGQLRPDSTWFYIDMELCSVDLGTYIKTTEPVMNLPRWEARPLQMCHILDEIVNGLVFIHENKEVHRDISPQNGTVFKHGTTYLILYGSLFDDR